MNLSGRLAVSAAIFLLAGSLLAVPGCGLPIAALGADAPPPGDDPAVESGRRALREAVSFPWYDQQADAPRRIDVEPPPPPTPSKSSSRDFSLFRGDFSVFTMLAWVAIALALALLAYLLIRAFLDRERRTAQDRRDTGDAAATEIDRIEQLPIPLRRPQGDLLSEAREHYRNGNYREAIIYLYSHLLIELDKKQMIALARGKTNRQYLRELASRQGLRGLLEQTMITFEDVFFGDLAISRERFEHCWNRLPDFDSLLQGRGA